MVNDRNLIWCKLVYHYLKLSPELRLIFPSWFTFGAKTPTMLTARQLQRVCLLIAALCLILLSVTTISNYLYRQYTYGYETFVWHMATFHGIAKDTLLVLLVVTVGGAVYLAKKE